MREGSEAWEIGISATNSRGLKGLDTFCFTPRAFIEVLGLASPLPTVAPVACCGGATIRHRYTRRPSGTALLEFHMRSYSTLCLALPRGARAFANHEEGLLAREERSPSACYVKGRKPCVRKIMPCDPVH